MTARKRFYEICESMSMLDESKFLSAVQILLGAKKRGSFVYLCGNGGSAATCAHFANDLLKMCGIRAVDVSGMIPTTLAYGNDHGWERMFANPIIKLADPMDVVVVISCSGMSENILRVVEDLAHKCEIIALTGAHGGELAKSDATVVLNVMAEDITAVEDVHLILCHEMVREIVMK